WRGPQANLTAFHILLSEWPAIVVHRDGSTRGHGGGVLRQNSVRLQVIDLSALIRRRSRLNGHSPAPPASTAPDALRRPPSGRPGEPCFAPPARHLQEDGEPAEVARQCSTVLGRVVQGVGRLEQALVIVSPNTVLRW